MLFIALNVITSGLHTIANIPLSKRKRSFTIAISIRFEGDHFCSKKYSLAIWWTFIIYPFHFLTTSETNPSFWKWIYLSINQHAKFCLILANYVYLFLIYSGRDGLTHNMLELIHSHWRRQPVCKVRCRGVPTVDMDNICHHLEVHMFIWNLILICRRFYALVNKTIDIINFYYSAIWYIAWTYNGVYYPVQKLYIIFS